jgi:DNA invertase Pin-like site-specific DNA recombinase
MKIGIYCRVSTEEQKLKGVSLKDQKNRGIEFCIENNYSYKIYEDGGFSGTLNVENRPGLNKLMDDIFTEEIDSVYVVDWDRFTRVEEIGVVLKNTFQNNNIRVFENGNEIDLNDENQSLLLGIKNLLSSYEIQKLKVRIKRSLERNVIEGKVGGGKLINYGYTKGENKKLVIDEYESEIIRIIFQKCIGGSGTKMISEFLNENKIPTKRMRLEHSGLKVKGRLKEEFIWRDSVIYSILTNPIYMGERRYKGKLYKCPSIISKEEFELTQITLKERKNFKDTTNKYFYLLKGLVFCLECENRFYGRKREDLSDNQYICSSQRYKGEFCGTRGINIDKLNNHVWESVKNLSNEVRKIIDDDIHPLYEKQLERLTNSKEYIRKLERRKERLIELYTDEEKENILVEYFTKYPDQIKSISVVTVGNPNQLAIPILNNIGGIIKYK